MNYKFIVPYLFTATAIFHGSARSQSDTPPYDYNIDSTKIELSAKGDSLSAIAQTDSVAPQPPQVIGVRSHGKNVIYAYDDSVSVTRHGDGSRAWRNNNPGNLRYYQFAKDHGAVGEAGGFAVFPDEETGMAALSALLKTESYQKLSIANALKRYAEDPTYTKKLTRITGLPATTKLKDLSEEKLVEVAKTIRVIEGWIPGTEMVIGPTRQPDQMAQNIAMIRAATQFDKSSN